MSKETRSKVLDMIAADMKNDASAFDGRPFTGKVVSEYLANLGAAVSALAKIIKTLSEEVEEMKKCKE